MSLGLKRSFSFHTDPLGTLTQEVRTNLPEDESTHGGKPSRQPKPATRQYWSLDSTKLSDDSWHMSELKRDQQKKLLVEPAQIANIQNCELINDFWFQSVSLECLLLCNS